MSLVDKYYDSETVKVIVLVCNRFTPGNLADFGSFFLGPKNKRKKYMEIDTLVS